MALQDRQAHKVAALQVQRALQALRGRNLLLQGLRVLQAQLDLLALIQQ